MINVSGKMAPYSVPLTRSDYDLGISCHASSDDVEDVRKKMSTGVNGVTPSLSSTRASESAVEIPDRNAKPVLER